MQDDAAQQVVNCFIYYYTYATKGNAIWILCLRHHDVLGGLQGAGKSLGHFYYLQWQIIQKKYCPSLVEGRRQRAVDVS